MANEKYRQAHYQFPLRRTTAVRLGQAQRSQHILLIMMEEDKRKVEGFFVLRQGGVEYGK